MAKRNGTTRRKIGKNLRAVRHRLGLLQPSAARRLGISTDVYGAWERGEVSIPLEATPTICKKLGCQVVELVGAAA